MTDKMIIESRIEQLSKVQEVSMHDAWFDIATEEHFWLEWRLSVLQYFKNYLPEKSQKILEIGCGNGVVLGQLEKLGYNIDGCDLNAHALGMVGETTGRLMVYNIFDLHPSLLEKYDCVLLLDVIEHIEEDDVFLNTAMKYVKPGGSVIVNVPAGSYLYGKYDKEVGHIRRYSKSALKKLFDSVGLKEISVRYWAMSLIPFALARKALHFFKKRDIIESGMKPPGPLAHKMLKTIKSSELYILQNPPIGASVMAAAIKPMLSYNEQKK